jgi:hypothetical protein
MSSIRFRCAKCGQIHEGLPDPYFSSPVYYEQIPPDERASSAILTSDLCIIEDRDFFVRGCLEIPIKGTQTSFAWGVWVSLSKPNFQRYVELFDSEPPEGEGPYFGWLSNQLPDYPDTLGLKTHVHLRAQKQRPSIELESTDHPLAVHQREGIALDDLLEFIGDHLHG